jgi:predicted nucleic acid-binding protein
MSRFLLDTNVISELRRPRPDPAVTAWVAGLTGSVFGISAITVGEIQCGIEKLRPADVYRAAAIELWLQALVASIRVFSVDEEVGRIWGRLYDRRQHHLAIDALIAATAQANQLTVATRNLSHFTTFGVPVFNPFS